ncbi:hypothetical protein XU18_1124 [Perkinsela sp. CCAP 1560/4]|nr:hypothetical protein XU18_1124 [Perkinsela sp. CCAP 1560/4]|eukprot:KNH08359.1 hypothetical protein XU18_1124 [Perkinsela sp. CCAP 1560/4]
MFSSIFIGWINAPLFKALTSSMVSFQILPGGEECVYDEVFSTGDKMFIHYNVADGNDVQATAFDPEQKEIYRASASQDERLLFRASSTGKYCTCFKNYNTRPATISFMSQTQGEESVQSVVGDGLNPRKSQGIEDMEANLLRITSGLKEIRNEQNYLSNRERIQRESAETANSRFIFWGCIEMFVMIFIAALQVRSLERCFDHKRSI